ncbi:hypothetical protein LEP3755_35770 [Leptolyngbya sp. NIES-3755]|nr:hypothetical protein LEP3755_35770 [Leptolyngbya sp. NIES-3755]
MVDLYYKACQARSGASFVGTIGIFALCLSCDKGKNYLYNSVCSDDNYDRILIHQIKR